MKADDTALKELSQRPTSATTETGFYRDLDNNSTIIVTDGSWTTLEYGGESNGYANIALGADVTTAGLSEKAAQAAQNITDGDYTTELVLTDGKNTSVIIDLKESYKLNKILVKWGGTYARSFRLSVSDSAKEDAEWVDVFEKEKGGGGTDTVLLDTDQEYRYIRITDIDTLSKTGAALIEVEAYGELLLSGTDDQAAAGEEAGLKSIPAVVWYVAGGISAAILIGCAVAAFLIAKKKKKAEEEN